MANRNMSKEGGDYYPGYRHPKLLIGYVVWSYHRFMLSLRDVSEQLMMRGIIVSHETIREWSLTFGQIYGNEIKRRAPRRGDKWHMDEMCLVMKGKKHWLWRAVDQHGYELDILLQSRKNKEAAKRFFRKLLKGLLYVPRVIITDKLPSYGAAKKEILPGVEHRSHKGLNNRAENSHQPTRQQEKQMRKFKSPKQAQRFLPVHGQIRNLFGAHRYKMAANDQRKHLIFAWDQWQEIVTQAKWVLSKIESLCYSTFPKRCTMISFQGRHFPKDLILMAVRWKLAYPLSYRNIEELMDERGADVDHSTVQKWVVHYAPQLDQSFRKRKKPVGSSWRMDETYIKVNGKWVYLYRAVDKEGNTVDFMLSEKRDRPSVLKFFKKAIGSSGLPQKVNIDKSGSNTAALERINNLLFMFGLWHLLIEVRRIKYMNNMVEQDHRGIKNITKYTLGFKSFEAAEATISGIELHRMLKKGQLQNAGDMPAWKQFYELAA